MADHPLRPAIDHRLGQPLPNQLANRTQAPHQAVLRPLAHRRHAVLAAVSRGYPPPNDKSLRDTHPSATARTRKHAPCDLHVLSMPPAFALSQDQTLRFIMIHAPIPRHHTDPQAKAHKPTEQKPNHAQNTSSHPNNRSSIQRHISKPSNPTRHPLSKNKPYSPPNPEQHPAKHHHATPIIRAHKDAANISLPL